MSADNWLQAFHVKKGSEPVTHKRKSVVKTRQHPRTARIEQEAREKFLAALSQGASVSGAANASGLPRSTAYDLRKEEEIFAKAWDEAVEAGTDALEDEAIRRAKDGVPKPVFYKGMACGEVQEYSDSLLMFTLRARRPDKYRENMKIDVTGTIDLAERVKRAAEKLK